MQSQGERIRALEIQVHDVRVLAERLDREINGPGNGNRNSIRRRLHDLMGTVAGLNLKFEVFERERAKASQDEQAASDRRFGRGVQLLLAFVAVWGVLVPTLTLYFSVRGR